jgi:hypothetical protein
MVVGYGQVTTTSGQRKKRTGGKGVLMLMPDLLWINFR